MPSDRRSDERATTASQTASPRLTNATGAEGSSAAVSSAADGSFTATRQNRSGTPSTATSAGPSGAPAGSTKDGWERAI
ncbi:hypothetical protein I317_04587 [Kwoniella heveanensis CBS 569]|uniref:Uncharacterized protein n=1 Tax=Kwoniella heveanensis BCC8398 TaxID=1296120 RepID=A0A1B9GHI5_9TREE|nr:hypothetical protein I316_07902 [Kwoniella heveanensis BCC8398]OCF41575.1 hypothetical protein I317_04587 [Kwoniella heveanensis CBS 569]